MMDYQAGNIGAGGKAFPSYTEHKAYYQAGNIGAWGKGTLARTRLIVHMIFIVVLATRMEITLRDSGKSQKLDTNRLFDFWPHL